MATDEECVGYARECVRLAGLATDYELQEQLLQMARNWDGPSHARALQGCCCSQPLHRSHPHAFVRRHRRHSTTQRA